MKRFRFLLILIPIAALLVFAGINLGKAVNSLENIGTVQKDLAGWIARLFAGEGEQRIRVENNGRTVIRAAGAFATGDMDVMVPADSANDVFDCFAYMDEDNVLHLQRGKYKMDASPQEGDAGSRSVFKEEDGYYLSVAKTCAALNLDYIYDAGESKLSVTPKDVNEAVLPARFDLRDYGRAPEVKNQGKLETCWAFAALSCVEAAGLPRESSRLSVDHLAYNNSFGLDINVGGAYTMGMSYLLGWQGPVSEDQDPYNDGKTDSGLYPVKHVQEIRFIDEKDYGEIKRSIYKYGPVETNIRNTLKSATSDSPDYNKEHSAYYYSGTGRASHEIIIVGWDDDYPRENFNETPEGNGAFICQNSWGSEFGEEGYFYVSYYDSLVGTSNLVYSSVEEPDNYDDIYQTDLCGWVGQVGCGGEHAFAMNVYTADSDSSLEAMGFYATSKGMSYKLYVLNDLKENSEVDLSGLEPVASGSLDMMGFYTVPIDKVELKEGEHFAVAMELDSPGNSHPVAVEHRSTDITQNAEISDGEGYISPQGSVWANTEENYKCNICLKAYTKDIEK